MNAGSSLGSASSVGRESQRNVSGVVRHASGCTTIDMKRGSAPDSVLDAEEFLQLKASWYARRALHIIRRKVGKDADC